MSGGRWVKGNTHAHTTNSDGGSSPRDVAAWYRDHGYHFLAITDHGFYTDPATVAGVQTDDFILIGGEEVNCSHQKRASDVCAIGLERFLLPTEVGSHVETLQRRVDEITAAGALPIIAHPNFGPFASDHNVLRQVGRFRHFEIFNYSAHCHNEGDAAHLSVEQMWDVLLSEGRDLCAVAADDTHNLTGIGYESDGPGGGWIMVHVDSLTPAEVLGGLRRGDFYASTGVELADYTLGGDTIHVSVTPVPNRRYTIRFIGMHGRILQETEDTDASYRVTGKSGEEYVRAKIIEFPGYAARRYCTNDDKVAWTQPVRLGKQ